MVWKVLLPPNVTLISSALASYFPAYRIGLQNNPIFPDLPSHGPALTWLRDAEKGHSAPFP